MKRIIRNTSALLVLGLLLLTVSSCVVEKRLHNKGFHIRKSSKVEIVGAIKEETQPIHNQETASGNSIQQNTNHETELVQTEVKITASTSNELLLNDEPVMEEEAIEVTEFLNPEPVPAKQAKPRGKEHRDNHKSAMNLFRVSIGLFLFSVLMVILGISGADIFLVIGALTTLNTIVIAIIALFRGVHAYKEKRYFGATHSNAHRAPIVVGLGGLWILATLLVASGSVAAFGAVIFYIPIFFAVNTMFKEENDRKIFMIAAMFLGTFTGALIFLTRGGWYYFYIIATILLALLILYLIFDNTPAKKKLD